MVCHSLSGAHYEITNTADFEWLLKLNFCNNSYNNTMTLCYTGNSNVMEERKRVYFNMEPAVTKVLLACILGFFKCAVTTNLFCTPQK